MDLVFVATCTRVLVQRLGVDQGNRRVRIEKQYAKSLLRMLSSP